MLLFITGWYKTLQDDHDLVAVIDKAWKPSVPLTERIYARHDESLDAKLRNVHPTPGEGLVIAGFSFGAMPAIELCQLLYARPLSQFSAPALVLLDPVNKYDPEHPSVGFTVPVGVRAAWCIYRAAAFVHSQPWSGYFRQVALNSMGLNRPPPVTNIPFAPTAGKNIGDQHGEAVWKRETYLAVREALKV